MFHVVDNSKRRKRERERERKEREREGKRVREREREGERERKGERKRKSCPVYWTCTFTVQIALFLPYSTNSGVIFPIGCVSDPHPKPTVG